jgi:SAM domain (Sterile alpha motif)
MCKLLFQEAAKLVYTKLDALRAIPRTLGYGGLGRPVAEGFGKCGAVTTSVRSLWYRVTVRLCCCRVVRVHIANPRLVQETFRNHGGHHDSTFFKRWREQEPRGLNLDIDGWLCGIGLAQYAEMFRANHIDLDLLGRLTNDDSQGHRRRVVRPSQETAGRDRRT